MPVRCTGCGKRNKIYRMIERVGICEICYNDEKTMEKIREHHGFHENYKKKATD